jgi:hypothetical protein
MMGDTRCECSHVFDERKNDLVNDEHGVFPFETPRTHLAPAGLVKGAEGAARSGARPEALRQSEDAGIIGIVEQPPPSSSSYPAPSPIRTRSADPDPLPTYRIRTQNPIKTGGRSPLATGAERRSRFRWRRRGRIAAPVRPERPNARTCLEARP